MSDPSWSTTTAVVTYPNGHECMVTTIRLDNNVKASYYHVDGGFVMDRYRSNSKVYTDERDIRRAVLVKIRTKIRRWDGMIANLWDELNND